MSAATPEAADRQVFLNITDRVNAEHNESGLLGMAFAPDFATTGHAYLSYTGFGSGALNLVTRLSRFTSSNGGASLSRASEKVLLELEQPDRNHNGGHIAFGPDGYLYLGLGDGGSANDPRGHGQNRETWFGSILRLDVSGEDYVIPPTNPFANGGGAPEIYAYGFRNPWRWSFDRSTGQLWLGDVGQNAYEEIDLVELGGNYGWATREGRHCLTSESCDTTALIDPIVEYPQEDGYAVVGGHVYRGDDLPSLVGTYLYADYGTRRLWALEYNPVTGEPAPHELLRTPGRFASFAEAVDGELHLLRYTDGALFKLVGATAADAATDGFPRLLTATGCVAPNDVTEWAPGVIPFDVVSSLWADGASKERAFAIPEGTSIQVDTDGDFHLPTGSVVLKTFSIGDRRVETRLLVHHEDGGWAGYAYRWNEDQSDAELATGAAVVTVAGQRHYIPSSSDCLQCHTGVAGSTLGLELAQLGGNVTYPTGRTSNQLDTLSHIGVIPGAEGLPSYASLVELAASTQVEARARSYLHTNCSNCHRPGGPGLGDLDLRFQTPLESTGACDVEPQNGDLGIQSAHIVPGAPEQSIIPRRMRSLAAVRMPPLASEQVDLDGVAAVEQWIATMPGCDAQ